MEPLDFRNQDAVFIHGLIEHQAALKTIEIQEHVADIRIGMAAPGSQPLQVAAACPRLQGAVGGIVRHLRRCSPGIYHRKRRVDQAVLDSCTVLTPELFADIEQAALKFVPCDGQRSTRPHPTSVTLLF
jgi:hypothetical protein